MVFNDIIMSLLLDEFDAC